MVLVSEGISIEDYLLLGFLGLKHATGDHVRLQLVALSVAIDQGHFTLDLRRLAGEDHLTQDLGLLSLGTLLHEVFDDDLGILEDDFSQVNDSAGRQVGNLGCVGTVRGHQTHDTRVELLLDLVKVLVLMATAKDDDD